jgi:hypothetical protein
MKPAALAMRQQHRFHLSHSRKQVRVVLCCGLSCAEFAQGASNNFSQSLSESK